MLQKRFAKILDSVSMIYMGTKKRRPAADSSPRGLDAFLDENRGFDPMKFFENHGLVPEIEFGKPARRRGYTLTAYSFSSVVDTPHPANDTVSGRMYEIAGKPAAPTMIVLHGWRMESYAFFDYYCRLLVRAGFNAVLIDLPYHMNRRVPASFHGEYTFSDDVALTLRAMKQAVADIQSVINWLKARGVEKIGMYGVSYGAMLSGITGCVDPSVGFMMLVAPPANLYEVLTRSGLGKKLENWSPKMHSEMTGHRELVESISLVRMKPQMPPERIFLVMAEYDGMVCNESIESLWLAWERPYMERYMHGHLSVILFNPSMNRDMRRWLKNIHDPGMSGS